MESDFNVIAGCKFSDWSLLAWSIVSSMILRSDEGSSVSLAKDFSQGSSFGIIILAASFIWSKQDLSKLLFALLQITTIANLGHNGLNPFIIETVGYWYDSTISGPTLEELPFTLDPHD